MGNLECIADFLKNKNVKKVIGFSGGSGDDISKLSKIVNESVNKLANYPIAILSGGTNFGMPKCAVETAKKHNIPTIGIMPKKGEKHSLENLDLKLVIEPRYGDSEWGDESEIFAKLADGVVFVGGMYGTLIEYAHLMKINIDRVKKKKTPCFLAPVYNTGGITMAFKMLPATEESKSFLPENELISGDDAAEYLIKKLFL